MRGYLYPSSKRPYRFERRTFDDVNGGAVVGSLLPYTYGTFLKPCRGPRGGKAYRTCYRALWYSDGRVCKVSTIKNESGDYIHVLEPFTGRVYNRYDHDESAYILDNGKY